ncbi:hypothetical protein ACFYSH_32080 [Streptomyces sp. NPDC005791]|uniref:hypothetical protein n=1 Tax=Streptomyces sp. NPDC005791 TaxID=3364732 RepID=UPI003681E77B
MTRNQGLPEMPGHERETFYRCPLRWRANFVALSGAGLAALALVATGSIASPRGDSDDAVAQEFRVFLSDLHKHRPERILDSGRSVPGEPVVIRLPEGLGEPMLRVAYRCHGKSATVTATEVVADGVGRRSPATSCGPTIASVAASADLPVRISSEDDRAIILWAILSQ